MFFQTVPANFSGLFSTTALTYTLYSIGLHATPQNWPQISFVLCILCLYLSCAALCCCFQYISLLFHIICKFLKTTVEFYSYLLPLNIIWCLLLHRYLINHCAYARTPFIIHSIGKGLNCPTLFRNMSNMKILEKRWREARAAGPRPLY